MSKKLIGLTLVALLIGVAIAGVVKDNIENTTEFDNISLGSDVEFLATEQGLAKGEMAPDFELETLDGKTVKLSDYKGKKVILNFWATWCPPCRAEMPHMQAYYEDQAASDNVEILAVNLTKEDHGLEKIKTFKEEYGLSFPIPMDENGEIGSLYQAVTIPTSYILDTQGRVQTKFVGPMDEATIEQIISTMD
ncbi:MAG TPA: TlpA disulfide reductase family protein [Planococcus sp. (in: firmicutes)]|nr:TlpA disulfide reductase family protein [Planococcus sp. (in: firmicutes)]